MNNTFLMFHLVDILLPYLTFKKFSPKTFFLLSLKFRSSSIPPTSGLGAVPIFHFSPSCKIQKEDSALVIILHITDK